VAGPRQPIELLKAKGAKHLTKAEIREREETEIKANSDKIEAPSYLPEELKIKFNEVANELNDIGIMSNLDCEALARYLIAEFQYQKVVKKAIKMSPENEKYMDLLLMQEKLFKMARSSAGDLGLTISSRCKLVIPKVKEEKPNNKFSKFAGGASG
jgi:P27 family predicted phage terminase small subunit